MKKLRWIFPAIFILFGNVAAAQTVQSGNPNPGPVGIVSTNAAVCDPYNPTSCLTPGTSAIANSTGTAGGATTATIPAVVGKTNYLCSLDVESLGGTAAVSPITVTGLLGGTIVYQGFTSAATGASFVRTYNPCLPASAANTAITVTTTASVGATVEVIASGLPTSAAFVNGSVQTFTTDQPINLTSLGGVDWAAFGYHVSAASIERNVGGGSLISTLTGGSGTFNNVAAPSFSATWTNGMPDMSIASERYAVFNSAGLGNGMSFTVPASASPRTLTVYAAVSASPSGMKMTATLSDGSAGPYTDVSVVGGATNVLAAYTITYRAASAGQTLNVSIVNNTGNVQSVNVYAATLN